MTSLIDKKVGYRRHLKLMIEAQWEKPDSLKELQFELVRSIVAYAASNIQYYGKLMARSKLTPGMIKDPEDFPAVPISTKSMIRTSYPRHVYRRGSLLDMKTRTSGSTGESFECMIDGRSHGWRLASKYLFDSWMRIRPEDTWMRISSHAGLTEKIRAWLLGGERVVPIEYTAKRNFRYLIGLIERARPEGLLGVPSSIALLAMHMQEAGVNLAHDLGGIVCTGETFPKSQRSLIESVIDDKVFNRYGLRELGGYIAQDCDNHSGLHVNPFLVHAEVIRGHRPARLGELGRLILTDLRNYSMPLIRYDTGDLASIERPCMCGRGFPVISSLVGRENELIHTKLGLLPSYTVTDKFALAFSNQISSFQFVQTSSGTIVVRLVPKGQINDDLRIRIKNFLSNFLPSLQLEELSEIRPDPSGKTPIFRSLDHSI